MRLLSRKLIHLARPFEGRGVSLYAAVGSGPGVDPGANAIRFRDFRLIRPGLHIRGHTWSINDGVLKTTRIAHADDPDTEIVFTTPAAWLNRVIRLQLRTHWHDCENTSNPDPYRLDLTAGGEVDPIIHGTGRIINAEKYTGGIYRLRVIYTPASHGTQPDTILIRKSAGPGTLADVTATFDPNQPTSTHDTAALTNATSYTFQAYAKLGSVELLLDSITFTADAAGPPAPTALTLTAF